jgi:hypothetical protein
MTFIFETDEDISEDEPSLCFSRDNSDNSDHSSSDAESYVSDNKRDI